jgi:hypothetical protein
MRTVPGGSPLSATLAAAALIAALGAWLGASSTPATGQVTPVPAPGSAQTTANTNPTAALSGIVVDAVTKRPVAGAVVSLGDLDDRQNLSARMVTDARGRFLFRNLKPSKGYYLGARRFGYFSTRYGWTGPNQSLTINDIARIVLTDGQWIGNLSIPLWQLAAISGRVVDERGEPVVGAAVRVFSIRRISGQPQHVAGPIATTDDRGVYRIAELDPGRYVVGLMSVQSTVLATTVEMPLSRPIGELATGGIGGGRGTTVSSPGIDVDGKHRLVVTNFATPPPPSAGQSRAYPAIFHPGARSAADALPIDITYGDNRGGVDFQLQPVPTARVSGRLVAPSGSVPGLLLRLMPVGSERLGFGSEAATTTVDRDGTFTFLNVPDGDYTLLAKSSVMDFTTGSSSVRFPDAPGFPAGGIAVGSYDGAPGLGFLARNGQPVPLWGRIAVTVGQRDIDDLVVPLQPTVTIRGRVVLEPGVKNDGRLMMMAQPADGDPTLGMPSGAVVANDPALSFSIQGVMTGRYLLSNFNGLSIVSVMSAGKDVRDTGLEAAGRDIEDVIVTLTDKHAQVNGTVSGRPGPVAAIIAFPVEREQWTNYGWEPARFRTVRAGSAGTFQIERLPAGEYFLIAVNPAQIDAWTDPQFLAVASARATRVTLAWGDKKTQDLTYAEIVIK